MRVWVAVDAGAGSTPASDCVVGVYLTEEALLAAHPEAMTYEEAVDSDDQFDAVTYAEFEVEERTVVPEPVLFDDRESEADDVW